MKRTPDDDWRTPSLKRFGDELRELEKQDNERAQTTSGRRRRLSALLVAPGIAIAAVALVLVLALSGGPASASSPVQRAPAAAIAADSVSFHSLIAISARGHVLQRYRQTGEIDFANATYRTKLAAVGGAASVEWRSVDGVLYLGVEKSVRPGLPRGPTKWIGVQLSEPQKARLAATPEGDALTDPIALLRIMANLDAPAALVGREIVQGAPAREYEVRSTAASVLRASSHTLAVPAAYQTIASKLNVWLDQAGRPVRVVELLSRTSARGPVTLRNSLEFIDYGGPVAIEAPRNARIASSLRGEAPSSLIGNPSRLFQSLTR